MKYVNTSVEKKDAMALVTGQPVISVSFSVCDQHDLVDSLVNAISWQMRSVSFCEYLAPFFLLRITWDCVLKKSRNIFAKKVMNGESLVEVEVPNLLLWLIIPMLFKSSCCIILRVASAM